MALEKRTLSEVDKNTIYRCCGFIDIHKIHPDAWPALVVDQSAGEQGIMTLAFGYTRLIQPNKPVTKGQAASALSTSEEDAVEKMAELERLRTEREEKTVLLMKGRASVESEMQVLTSLR